MFRCWDEFVGERVEEMTFEEILEDGEYQNQMGRAVDSDKKC